MAIRSRTSVRLKRSSGARKPLVGVVDFFCGSGGVSTGLQAVKGPVRYEIIEGIDIDPHCAKTFETMIGAPCRDIDVMELSRNEKALRERIRSWNVEKYDKLLLIGCSPCQGFAAHRKSIREHDPRRNLFRAFCKIASVARPDAILLENVPDLFSADHWPHFAAGRRLLVSKGYEVRGGIYNLAGFGLAQERFRAVVMGFRDGFELPCAPLHPKQYRTVRDAIGHLPPLKSGEADPADPMHVASKHRESTLEILRSVPKNGGNRPVGVGPACLDRTRKAHGGYTDVYGRLAWDRPSVTITARCRTPSCGRFAHPEQDRGLTTREAALLQGFPLGYIFSGPFDDGFKQVGNAVSPIVAERLGEFIGAKLAKTPLDLYYSGVSPTVINAPVGPGFAVTINGIKRQRERLAEAA
jgi:DNA (cytosine-5)-methyltransferase 1